MKKIFLAACVFALSACAHEGTVSDIDVGMTRADIIKAMGEPQKDNRQGVLEEMTYSQRKASGWRISRQDYTIILLNDAVVQINPNS
ncbi:hypothetical protein TUM12370_10500 [Salmonella enterica subsp. enterica serovar Choleraesuis]|nr:hypothetical protein TUM12370_10500 [Salmonella enterica subsp. enterica serovar Choleraesuis]